MFSGLSRELAYVRDGVFLENALAFVIPLAENKNRIHFQWRARQRTRVSFTTNYPLEPYPFTNLPLQIPYKMKLSTSDPLALHQPTLNISHSGLVPTSPPFVFRVTLPCSGRQAGKVIIGLEIEVELESGEKKVMHIQRMKECRLDENLAGDERAGGVSGSEGVAFSEMVNDRTPPHLVFLGVLLGACLVVVAMVVGTSY